MTRDVIIPTHWRSFFEASGIPAAVRVDGHLVVSGHTGEDVDGRFSSDPAIQFRSALRMLTMTLTEAGMTWADVIEIQSFHIDLPAHSPWILEIAREFMQPPLPAWTAVGIATLYEPDALVEVSCKAYAPSE